MACAIDEDSVGPSWLSRLKSFVDSIQQFALRKNLSVEDDVSYNVGQACISNTKIRKESNSKTSICEKDSESNSGLRGLRGLREVDGLGTPSSNEVIQIFASEVGGASGKKTAVTADAERLPTPTVPLASCAGEAQCQILQEVEELGSQSLSSPKSSVRRRRSSVRRRHISPTRRRSAPISYEDVDGALLEPGDKVEVCGKYVKGSKDEEGGVGYVGSVNEEDKTYSICYGIDDRMEFNVDRKRIIYRPESEGSVLRPKKRSKKTTVKKISVYEAFSKSKDELDIIKRGYENRLKKVVFRM